MEKNHDNYITRNNLPRCTGHCCKGFSLEYSQAEVMAEYELWKKNPSEPRKIKDVAAIAEMIIPLGVFRKQELFTCKHLGKDGNCQNYEARPQMCRDFPGPNPCPFRNCASHGYQPIWKKVFNWLLE